MSRYQPCRSCLTGLPGVLYLWPWFYSLLKTGVFFSELREIFSSIKKFFSIFLASVLISVNWLTYIWAVNHDHIIETSLGYYINPLVSVLLGVIVLKEKLSLWQTVSFVLAAIGVLNMTLHFGSFPWIALVLAMSFGFYGLCKKIIHLGAVTGIAVETMFISPFALLYLYYAHSSGVGAFALNNPGVSWFCRGGCCDGNTANLIAGGTNAFRCQYRVPAVYFPTIALI